MIKKQNFLLFFLIIFSSCDNREDEQKNRIIGDIQIAKKHYKFDNPALFMGTTFGHFIQGLHKLGDYEQMLNFTSKNSREQFDDSTLLEFFQRMNFSYPLKLKSFKNNILLYSTRINATEKTIQMKVEIENDTSRLVLNTLNPQKPFIGIWENLSCVKKKLYSDMWAEAVFYKKYEYKGRLAFGLSLKFIDNGDQEENFIYIESDIIPNYIFKKYNNLIDEKFVFLSHGYQKPDKKYCCDLLDIVAEEILRKSTLKKFFYPEQFLLKNSELDQKKINYFANCRREVVDGKMNIYEKNSPFHLYFISQILNYNAELRRASKLKSFPISRTMFEKKIVNNRQAEIYVDEFHSVTNFKLITHSQTEVLACALNFDKLIFALNIENKLVELWDIVAKVY